MIILHEFVDLPNTKWMFVKNNGIPRIVLSEKTLDQCRYSNSCLVAGHIVCEFVWRFWTSCFYDRSFLSVRMDSTKLDLPIRLLPTKTVTGTKSTVTSMMLLKFGTRSDESCLPLLECDSTHLGLARTLFIV